jgi:ZIP family zinc transporter/zinc and cadmium transporter
MGGWAKKNSLLLIGFAAGVMLVLSFCHFLPEAVKIYPDATGFVLIGFFIMFFLQNVVMASQCHDENCHKQHISKVSVVALSFHSLVDGIIISAGFEISAQLGIFTAIAVLLHKLPDGVVITSILVHSGMKIKRTMLLSLMVALFTPLGTIIGYLLLSNLSKDVAGIFLAAVAGSFIYLAASDLIPETHKAPNRRFVSCFLFLGAALTYAAGYLIH